MEQIKVDFTRDKVAFVRAASQASLAKEPMTVGYYVNQKFVVRYVIYDNRIQNIIYDMSEMPNKETFDIMQRFLSIDNIERVTITIPVDKTIQVWRWTDLSKKVLDAEKEKEKVSNDIVESKEVLQNGKSKKNNLQNKSRRNKVVRHECDKVCNHRSDDGFCLISFPRVDKDTLKCDDYSPIM